MEIRLNNKIPDVKIKLDQYGHRLYSSFSENDEYYQKVKKKNQKQKSTENQIYNNFTMVIIIRIYL